MHMAKIVASALAGTLCAIPVMAQTSSTGSTTGGNTTSQAEKQRGVPGVDVDVNTREKGRNNGMPGVDVDTSKSRDRDMRASGAGSSTMSGDATANRDATRAARADRN